MATRRQEILDEYDVDVSTGIISGPGKFEGNMLYVPAIWNSGADESIVGSDEQEYGFSAFDDDDRANFPEIGNAYGCVLWETDAGIVYCNVFETKEQYFAAIDGVE